MILKGNNLMYCPILNFRPEEIKPHLKTKNVLILKASINLRNINSLIRTLRSFQFLNFGN